MHCSDARKLGETEMRIYLLPAWRESSLYSGRERAALAWTEALTRLADTGAPTPTTTNWPATSAKRSGLT